LLCTEIVRFVHCAKDLETALGPGLSLQRPTHDPPPTTSIFLFIPFTSYTSEGSVEHERAEENGEGDDGDELPVMEVGVEHSVECVGGDNVQLHAERDHT